MRRYVRPAKSSSVVVALVALCAVSTGVGIWVGMAVSGRDHRQNVPPSHSIIDSSVQKIKRVLTCIEQSYVDEKDMQALTDASVESILHLVDPHAEYTSVSHVPELETSLRTDQAGVGLELVISPRDGVRVIAAVAESPAARAGIVSNDKLLAIDGTLLQGERLKRREVNQLLLGEQGTRVKLTLQNAAGVVETTVVRSKMPLQTVPIRYMIHPHIGYIKISRFTASTFKECKAALRALQKEGMQNLLIDLRDNPGGYMEAGMELANELLNPGQLIVYSQGQAAEYLERRCATSHKAHVCPSIPVIVLINEGTAGTSEILTGSLQDNDRALIVGCTSFGRGLVQVPLQLPDGSQIQLTVGRYCTPSGRIIQKDLSDIQQTSGAGPTVTIDHAPNHLSLQYRTAQGRTVHGGGGIVPDCMLEDVSSARAYLDKMHISGVLHRQVSAYLTRYKETLLGLTRQAYIDDFKIDGLSVQNALAEAHRAGLTCPHEYRLEVERLVAHWIKAHLAEQLWDTCSYYAIAHQKDVVLQNALQLFSESEALLKHTSSVASTQQEAAKTT